MSPAPRLTTVLSLDSGTLRVREPEGEAIDDDNNNIVDKSNDNGQSADTDNDEGFTVLTTPLSTSSTRRGSVLFPRRPPLSGGSGAAAAGPFVRPPALAAARSTTLSTPLTAVPNIRKFQDIFSRRRSTTPPSSSNGGEEEEEEATAVEENDVDASSTPGETSRAALSSGIGDSILTSPGK